MGLIGNVLDLSNGEPSPVWTQLGRICLNLALFGWLLVHPGVVLAQSPTSTETWGSVQEQHAALLEAFHQQEWELTEQIAQRLIDLFPGSTLTQDGYYYLGVAYFEQGAFVKANRALSAYLSQEQPPQLFKQAITYKFEIASRFKEGQRRNLFGWDKMPKLLSGDALAISLYDEVIAALARSPIAAEALFGKGELLVAGKKYDEAIETFQILIRRFPQHPLAAESYLAIASSYLACCEQLSPDPDKLTLAQINHRKFRAHFPGEKRLTESDHYLRQMKERIADDLFETAQFYQRTHKPRSAQIYYRSILAQYPDTQKARTAQKLLADATPSDRSN